MRLFAAVVICAAVGSASTIDECRSIQRRSGTAAAASCFEKLAGSGDALTRAEALFGLQRYEDANTAFREAEHAQPKSAAVKTEWGKLFLDRSQLGDAAKLFTEAIEADKEYAPAYLCMAHATAENYDKAAVEFARTALEHDPKLAEAHEFLAYLALEDSDTKAADEEARQALGMATDAPDAVAVLASLDWLAGKTDSEWIGRVGRDAQGYAIGAHFLVINRRYTQGIALYRKALDYDPALWQARSQLALNLMRTGQTAEAQQQFERCYAAHFRDAQTVNALRLLDTLPQYEMVEAGSSRILLNKKEADVLRPYVVSELQRAIAAYQKKYKMALPAPVRLEIYPNHEDFIVRTLGLPGQGGLLGVTFGNVVAMDSPSARPPGEFSWAETLWHELSHVYVVNATHDLTPRWFTEGLSVHEEQASSPSGTERVTPTILAAVAQHKLLPVLELERGFVRPQYEGQVLVSYFEAGRMCDYIVEKWGDAAVLGMMHSYGDRKTTAEVIEANLHESPEAFDKDFLAWLGSHTPHAAVEPTPWDVLKQQAGTNERALMRLNYTYLEDADVHRRLGNALLASGKADGAVREYGAVIALHPDDVATAHYDLARALDAAHRTNEAKDQVLVALEAAPDYKPAQQLLLKLSQ